MTELAELPTVVQVPPYRVAPRSGIVGWITSTDHKRIGILTALTSLVFFVLFGVLALGMRTQLAFPGQHLITNQSYNELFTLHGSGMIVLVITPLAIALGVYLVPLQIGAPMIAAPKLCLFSYWLYLFGAGMILLSTVTADPPSAGWYSYMPLADSRYSPGYGMDLWILGMMMAVAAMMFMAGCVLFTALRMRAPGMKLTHMTVFTWSEVVTCLMAVSSFPALIGAMSMISVGRVDPNLFSHDYWVIAYQFMFWFYGHPVVYVMFFPFVGCVATVLSTFAGKPYFGYHFTIFALLAFSVGSMTVFGHHMFTTQQSDNQYFSLSSIMLAVPAGIEYFGFIATIMRGKLVFTTPMLFALAFIPQFLIGGLTGIMIATPVLDYDLHGTYFIVAHFHYTLFAGSVFGAFAGIYFWFPKATGVRLSERLGRLHFTLMFVGTNVAFLPMFAQGFDGLPRRVATYPQHLVGDLTVISTAGAAVIALGVLVFVVNVVQSLIVRVRAGVDPWHAGQSLEWATSSPPPMFNYDELHPIPKISSHYPLLELRWEAEREAERQAATVGKLAAGATSNGGADPEDGGGPDGGGPDGGRPTPRW